MEITPEVRYAITRLNYVGLRINKGNIGVVEEFNKMQYYRSCLKNPQSKVRNFSMGGMKLNERIITFIVSWMLTPRESNHSVLTEEDLVLFYCIINKIKIIWINMFKEHMQKSMRLSDYHYPHAILISKFLHFFEINLEEELSEVVKLSHEVSNGSLSKMGFIKIRGKWVSKDGDQVGSSSGIHAEDDGDDPVVVAGDDGDDGNQAGQREQGNEGPDEAFNAGLSAGKMDERITSMTPFQRLMRNRMNNFAYDQRNHHEFCMARF